MQPTLSLKRMSGAFARIVLLRNYRSPPEGAGRSTFQVGKGIGIAGRVVVGICLLAAVLSAAVDERTLLLSFLAAYVVVFFFVITEVLSSVLMFLGNWWAARKARLHEREA
jgi:hypothetical protein